MILEYRHGKGEKGTSKKGKEAKNNKRRLLTTWLLLAKAGRGD
jgi:hypothetical protein